MMVQKRGIVELILLSVFTCGLYNIYLYYKQADEISMLTGTKSDGLMEVLLVFVTCGIYGIYWQYKYAKRIYEFRKFNGAIDCDDITVLNVILSIFGFTLIAQAILQNEINKAIDQQTTVRFQ